MEYNYAIFVLQKEFESVKRRLDGDVIVDLRFKDEIEEDKRKLKQLKRSIEVLSQHDVISSVGDEHKSADFRRDNL